MTKFITAPAASGETFEFNSNAKNVPTYAVVATDSEEGFADLRNKEIAEAEDLAARGVISADDAARRIRYAHKNIQPEGSYMLSKHTTRAAAMKARNTIAARPTTARAEVVEVHPA